MTVGFIISLPNFLSKNKRVNRRDNTLKMSIVILKKCLRVVYR